MGRKPRGDIDPLVIVEDALRVVGKLGGRSVPANLDRAQAALYAIREGNFDPDRLRGVSKLIRGAAISLMQIAADLNAAASGRMKSVSTAAPATLFSHASTIAGSY